MSQVLTQAAPSRAPLVNPALPSTQTVSAKKIELLSKTHYGWCPYGDIELMGPMGLERYVAYDANGNFATRLLRAQLLVFTNVEIKQLSDKDNNIPNGPPPLLEDVVKYAGTCIGELEDAYGGWGFMRLAPLTGLPPADAFRIMSTVQPYAFDMAELRDELGIEAIKRIAKAKAEDEKFADDWADQTRQLMQIGAQRAIVLAETNIGELRKDMVAYVATKVGRSYPSPGDIHLFHQLHEPLPSKVEHKAADDDVLRQLLTRVVERDLNAPPSQTDALLQQAMETIRKQDERQSAIEEELRLMREGQQAALNPGS